MPVMEYAASVITQQQRIAIKALAMHKLYTKQMDGFE